jgi:tetratricopeptide (TPR) repeat protein/predicted Ser/Thr protein kinase
MPLSDALVPFERGEGSERPAVCSIDTAERHLFRFLRDMEGDGAPTLEPTILESREARAPLRGRVLGRYVVIGELGSGGMGKVLKAYDESLDRAIAIKLLHSEVAKRHAERLKREALALAKLSHPNVVHVYEVGRAGTQWFLAMELVDGQTLRQWQQQARGWRECVEAYLQAGEGLAAAHAVGLVHRDFKPDNCIIDEKGRARVLDFGLVGGAVVSSIDETAEVSAGVGGRAVDDPLTKTGTVLGTPAYMPPEQMQGEEADARSDQFSFCVSLYEAVYGERPYAGQTLAALMESVLAGEVGAGPRGAAVPGRLRQLLLRGLAAEPERRWASMEVLLAELRRLVAPKTRRWLALGVAGGLAALGVGLGRYAEVGFRCEGSQAQLEGVWDEGRKQAVKAAVLGTGVPYAVDAWERAVEPTLDGYAAEWVAQHEDACEATSVRQEQSPELLDLRMGCLQRAKVELDAVVGVLGTADAKAIENAHEVTGGLPSLARCADVEALQAEIEPPAPHELEAVEGIRRVLAAVRADRNAGLYMAAKEKLEEATRALTEVEYGPVHTETELEDGAVLQLLGQYVAAEEALRRALGSASRWHQWDEVQRAATMLMRVVGVEQMRMEEGLRYLELAEELAIGDPLAEASVRTNLGAVHNAQGKYEEAETEHRRALALRETARGPDHPAVAESRHNLGAVLDAQGKYEDAETQHRQALDIRGKALGPDHPDVAMSRGDLATTLQHQGKYEDAEAEYRQALVGIERVLGSEHPDVAIVRNSLGGVLQAQGHYEDAEEEHRRALALMEGAFRSDHPRIAESLGNLACALGSQGKYAEAETQHRRALALLEEALGPEHAHVAAIRNNLGIDLLSQGKHEEAEAQHRRALEISEKALGSDHAHVAVLRNGLANTLVFQEKYEEAVAEFRRTLATKQESLDADHPDVALSRLNVANVLMLQGKYEEAEAEILRIVGIYEKALEPDHPVIWMARSSFAHVLLELGRATEAHHLAERAWARHQQADVPAEERATTAFILARAIWTTSRHPEQRIRARDLARRALKSYLEAGAAYTSDVENVRAWLARHEKF